ncbi:MAG: hypothetical protein H6728_15060 [Myxococcales bacterium]|nr:hypothetical protein [Myxococcales bacterium]
MPWSSHDPSLQATRSALQRLLEASHELWTPLLKRDVLTPHEIHLALLRFTMRCVAGLLAESRSLQPSPSSPQTFWEILEPPLQTREPPWILLRSALKRLQSPAFFDDEPLGIACNHLEDNIDQLDPKSCIGFLQELIRDDTPTTLAQTPLNHLGWLYETLLDWQLIFEKPPQGAAPKQSNGWSLHLGRGTAKGKEHSTHRLNWPSSQQDAHSSCF